LTLALFAVTSGFALLVWSAERFITGSASTASHFGISPLLIGMVIVGFGTSAPEMLVSAQAALDGNPDLALGNALGSNIVNTGLVLGITALVSPIVVHSKILRKEIPLLLAIVLLFGFFIIDGKLTQIESVLLLCGFVSLIAWAIYTAKRQVNDPLAVEVEQQFEINKLTLKWSTFWMLMGLLLMSVSSQILVWGAVGIAELMGVSNLVIGLTIVALGTSLPELAASVVAARKGQHDIAIGNVVGSNMFNILAVAGIAGFISPMSDINPQVILRDLPAVMLLTISLLFMAWGYKRNGERHEGAISRVDGSILLLAFVIYNVILLLTIR
jgi:cation:H+ antiporter